MGWEVGKRLLLQTTEMKPFPTFPLTRALMLTEHGEEHSFVNGTQKEHIHDGQKKYEDKTAMSSR